MAKVEQELAKEVADWIETSGMNKITKNLFKKNPAMAERAYKAAQEEAGTMPAKVASKADLIAPEDMPSPPPLASRAKAEPTRAGTPEATAAILNPPTETGIVKAGTEFEQPAEPSMVPKLYEAVDTYRGVGKLNGRPADVASDLPPGAASVPPKEGDVLEAQWSSKGEQGLVPLSPKELARAKTYAKTAGISEDAAKEKLFGKRAAIMGGLGAIGTAAALVRKDTADKEPSAVMETPSPLTEKGKAAYEATAKGQAAKPDYSAASLMQPVDLKPSKVGRSSTEAPDLTQEEKDLAAQLARFQEETKLIAAEYKATKDQQAKQQLWEGLVSGLGAIAAGMYGLKHGLDMSGVKFDRTNWEERAKTAREDMLAGRMAAEKDYELSKSIIEQRRDNKLTNWKINDKLLENAAREAARIDEANYRSASLNLESQKVNAQQQRAGEELNIKKAELMLKVKEAGGDAKAAAKFIDDFEDNLKAYGKNGDDLSLQSLKRINAEFTKRYGQPIVPESSFEGGWFSGPEAADIEKARTPSLTSSPAVGNNEIERVTKDGRKAVFDATSKQFIRWAE